MPFSLLWHPRMIPPCPFFVFEGQFPAPGSDPQPDTVSSVFASHNFAERRHLFRSTCFRVLLKHRSDQIAVLFSLTNQEDRRPQGRWLRSACLRGLTL